MVSLIVKKRKTIQLHGEKESKPQKMTSLMKFSISQKSTLKPFFSWNCMTRYQQKHSPITIAGEQYCNFCRCQQHLKCHFFPVFVVSEKKTFSVGKSQTLFYGNLKRNIPANMYISTDRQKLRGNFVGI